MADTGQLTTIYNAPSTCSLNPSIAGWGAQYTDQEVITSTLTNTLTDGDSIYILTTEETTTITSATPTWYVGAPYVSACMPPDGYYQYSPGVCPRNWTPNAISASGTLTSAVCCPTGVVADISDEHCFATVTTPIALYTGDLDIVPESFDPQDVTTVSSGIISEYAAIIVTWADTDLAQFTPASAPALMKQGVAFNPSTTATSAASTSSSPPPPTYTVKPDPGLSTGAKAGIGVGVGLVGLALIGVAIFLTFRYGKRRGKTDLVTHDSGFETKQRQTLQPELQM